MSNQFVNATPVEFYRRVIEERPQARGLVEAAAQYFEENPDECAVAAINSAKPSFMQIRLDGERKWVSSRVLLWVHLFDEAPVFGSCTCKTSGCMNPKHQNVLRDSNDCKVFAHKNEEGPAVFKLIREPSASIQQEEGVAKIHLKPVAQVAQ